MTPIFSNHKIEAPKVPNNIPRNPPSCLFISFFTVSLTPSINSPEFYGDFMILIISSISAFEVTQVVPFPALTTPQPRIFL